MTAKPSQRGNNDSEVLKYTSYIKFQNFQGPIPFSRTIQVLENGKKNFKDFQGKAMWPPCRATLIAFGVWLCCFVLHLGCSG